MENKKEQFIKKDLIKLISEELNLSKKDVTEVFNSLINLMTNILTGDNEIIIKEFGTFKPKITKPKIGYNMREKKPIAIPSRRVVKFKAGKLLKESVLRNKEKLKC